MTRLHIIPTPEAQPVDITLDRLRPAIEARDWSAVMVWGDRQPALEIGERPKRIWRR